ncbi:Mediator complex subunit Med17 [Botryosphaeria dothidea]|uniref:Mediator of RNA polymerase II transcription subunit 17 n=1 Tax=Botryosphaeria dothidea TaxID=55169 RepID=A0A8H4IS42_9PEZI|nr:Mediator complex subunit Med17 [Botryosphaeria dothidea]
MGDSQLSDASASFPLALRPFTSAADNDESLIVQLARISTQFGQFRHMNEDKLREMVAAREAGIAETSDDEDEDDDPSNDAKKRAEELRDAKAEMFRHINDAQQEILYTIDFLGLLLSKDMPRGSNYMSPTLKQSGVPEGSFAYDKWPAKHPDDHQKKRQDLVAKGWTMEGLGASADALLQAATKLEKEVRKETQYWGQILSIKKRGWSLRRVAPNSGTLGVQFGFLEANPMFHHRGFAPLRAKDDGNIILDQALVRQPKAVRVQVFQHGKVVGSSSQNNLAFTSQSDLEIEDLIRRARDSLFEEELFHEMSIESRQLLSYNIRYRDHVIIIPLGLSREGSDDENTREIHVDLIGIDDMEELPSRHPYDGLAEDVALGLRLLLTYVHSQKLRRRTQLPPALTERPRAEQQYPIIRTLLNFTHHHGATNAVRSYLAIVQRILARAGISLEINFESAFASLSETIKETYSARNRLPQLDALVAVLSRPLTTTAAVSLPSAPDKFKDLHQDLKITLRTIVAPPANGTHINLTIPPALAAILYHDNGQDQNRSLSFDALDSLKDYLDNAFSMDLLLNLVAKEYPRLRPNHRYQELQYIAKKEKDAENKEAVRIDMATHISGRDGYLKVTWCAPGAELDGDEAVWREDDGESRSFKEVVAAFANISAP